MPIYEYQCEECSHCFERLVFAGDPVEDPACPACGAKHARKLVSCTGLMSGSGKGLCAGGGSSRFS
jgi:putative FmdB family regulatory protein